MVTGDASWASCSVSSETGWVQPQLSHLLWNFSTRNLHMPIFGTFPPCPSPPNPSHRPKTEQRTVRTSRCSTTRVTSSPTCHESEINITLALFPVLPSSHFWQRTLMASCLWAPKSAATRPSWGCTEAYLIFHAQSPQTGLHSAGYCSHWIPLGPWDPHQEEEWPLDGNLGNV